MLSLIFTGITIGLSILAAMMTGLNTMLLIYGRGTNLSDLIGFTIIGITFFALHSLSKDNDAPRIRAAWVLNIILFTFTGFLPFVFTSGVGIIEIDPFSNNLMYGFLFFIFAIILLIAHNGHTFLMDGWQKFGLSFLIAEFSFNTVMHFMGNCFLFFPIEKRLFIIGITLNVVNLTFRLTRKRGSYFLQIYLSKDLTKPPKSEVASRPCQSRGCSQRREPLTALQGGQSYESNQHLQKHYSIHP